MLGDRIRRRRTELGLTQKELALRLGYSSRATINKIEKGINDIAQSKVATFAKALNTTPLYLMGLEESSRTKPNEILITKSNGETIRYEFSDSKMQAIHTILDGMKKAKD